jgi:signal peptidase I
MKSDKSKQPEHDIASIRDTVESIWIAIVLAFVLRAFMIEAFVIPTGSMAPRLMGEHWRLTCPACGYEYSYGLSRVQQLDPNRRRDRAMLPTDGTSRRGPTCPNCDFPFAASKQRLIPGNGDRVLVMKYLYEFLSPQPWDVVVFRNPQNNRENYIKRLIGLPGETIMILHGDIFVRQGDEGPLKIRRKPYRAQEAMWQVVFDNDYQPSRNVLREAPMRIVPPSWEPEEGEWGFKDAARIWAYLGGEPGRMVFQANRRHFLPTYGYNDPDDELAMIDIESDIVTDLRVSCVYEPGVDDSLVSLALSSMEYRFRGEVHAGGEVRLTLQNEAGPSQSWETDVGPLTDAATEIALTHVDWKVTLWIDGEAVLSTPDEVYAPDVERLRGGVAPEVPHVAIEAAGGPCQLSHVKLYRDVFYTQPRNVNTEPIGVLGEYAHRIEEIGEFPAKLIGWGSMANPIRLRDEPNNPALDEFFVLGDNSPQSLDGRAWTDAAPSLWLWRRMSDGRLFQALPEGAELRDFEHVYKLGTVPRYNLIGKAFFVYWPSGYRLPIPSLPLIPNVGRMRMIR